MTKELRTHPVVLRHLAVSRVQDLSPSVRRVTLTGSDLGGFERDGLSHPPFRSDSPDDHIKLFLARDGSTDDAVKLPVQAAGHLVWPKDHSITDRDYTVRRFDPGSGELDVEFFLHGQGPAAAWAAAATPGSTISIAGPRTSMVAPVCAHLVLAGDETALPAIGRWIDEAAPSTSITAVIEVESAAHHVPLRRSEGTLDITWCHRSDRERCDAALRLLPDFDDDVYVFVAGEFSMVAAARTHLKNDRELRPDRFRALRPAAHRADPTGNQRPPTRPTARRPPPHRAPRPTRRRLPERRPPAPSSERPMTSTSARATTPRPRPRRSSRASSTPKRPPTGSASPTVRPSTWRWPARWPTATSTRRLRSPPASPTRSTSSKPPARRRFTSRSSRVRAASTTSPLPPSLDRPLPSSGDENVAVVPERPPGRMGRDCQSVVQTPRRNRRASATQVLPQHRGWPPRSVLVRRDR